MQTIAFDILDMKIRLMKNEQFLTFFSSDCIVKVKLEDIHSNNNSPIYDEGI